MTPPISRSNTPPEQTPVASSSNSNAARAPESGSADAAPLDQTGLPGTQSPADRAALDRQYVSKLDRWVQKSPGAQREWVAGVIRRWMQGDRSGILKFNFSDCPDGLGHALPRRLPPGVTDLEICGFVGTSLGLKELPPSLERLFVANDQPVLLPQLPDGLKSFTQRCERPNAQGVFPIPNRWPPQLEVLMLMCVTGQQQAVELGNLPATLKEFYASGVRLTAFPTFGTQIADVYLHDNHITHLPQILPDSLTSVYLSSNPIVDIPEALFNHPGRTFTVSQDNMPAAVLERLRRRVHLRFANRITYSSDPSILMGHSLATQTVDRPPIDWNALLGSDDSASESDVDEWGSALEHGSMTFNWSGFEAEDGATQFGQFLRRLCGTSEYRAATTREEFTQRVNNLLHYLEGNTEARQQCFNLATEALASCEDRVALSLLDMEKLCRSRRMTDAIRAGEFRDRKQEVLHFCMENFCGEVVEQAARLKAASAHDPVEVHLGHIVAMSGEFKLPAAMNTLFYPGLSNITPHDVQVLREQMTVTPLNPSLYEHYFDGAARENLRALLPYSDPSLADNIPVRAADIDNAFLTSLSTSDAMHELMRSIKPRSMAKLEQRIAERTQSEQQSVRNALDELEDQTDRGELDSLSYVQMSKELMARYTAIPDKVRASETLSKVERFIKKHELDASLCNFTAAVPQRIADARRRDEEPAATVSNRSDEGPLNAEPVVASQATSPAPRRGLLRGIQNAARTFRNRRSDEPYTFPPLTFADGTPVDASQASPATSHAPRRGLLRGIQNAARTFRDRRSDDPLPLPRPTPR